MSIQSLRSEPVDNIVLGEEGEYAEELAGLLADWWRDAVGAEAGDVRTEAFSEHGSWWVRLSLPESYEEHEGTFPVVVFAGPGGEWCELEH